MKSPSSLKATAMAAAAPHALPGATEEIEEERRLFYVAMTRSQKFLHMTWAPIPGNQQAQKPSDRFGQRSGSTSGLQ